MIQYKTGSIIQYGSLPMGALRSYTSLPDSGNVLNQYLLVCIGSLKSKGYAWTCGQSYKGSTIVNYDSRVVPDLKIPQIMTLVL